jgi:egghead protein (zeste-white 4 protein)
MLGQRKPKRQSHSINPAETSRRQQAHARLGYYLAILLPMLAYLIIGHVRWATIYSGQSAGWNISAALLQAFLLIPCSYGAMMVAGMVVFGSPRDRRPAPHWRWDPDTTLIVAYVSRGQHVGSLRRASTETQKLLDMLGVRYTLETVTDVEVSAENRLAATTGEVLYYTVPDEYQTPRQARFKARALQYLLEQRTARLAGREDAENIWVLHLDEESIVTIECLRGIADHLARYDLHQTPGAIGQGEILYNSGRYGKYPLIEALDAIRTGDDLGRFRLQFQSWHRPVFGMHGSFILTPARVEREVTWDVGGYGSITEDAYFALVAMERGVRFDWVDGFIREQSPLSLSDLIQQRRRWFCGLTHIARDPSLKWSTTLGLKFMLFFWQLSWIGCIAGALYLVHSLSVGTTDAKYSLMLFATLSGGFFGSTYVVGAYRNVMHAPLSTARKIGNVVFTFIAWILMLLAMVEGVAVLYAIIRPVHHFYIVDKD